MFSPFTARRPEEIGSGGKAPRGRRRAAPASPYCRQENSQPPPAPEAGNPRWFSGIISGAGRLLSSVFRSNSGESASSYSSDSEGGGNGSSEEDGNADAGTGEFPELDKTGRSKLWRVHGEGPQLTTQRSEGKLAIENLLQQETFSRDESDRLIKIIQSRVVDTVEGVQAEFPDKTVHSDAPSLGTWRSANWGRKFPEGLAYSANYLNDFSPGTSILHAYSHDLCDKAVMEAKKWLERKKMESTSKSELDSGPCTFNTDVLQHCVEDEKGSPVDVAKSYMQARPPWQSPILSRIGLRTPPSGTLLFKDETPYSLRGDPFSTSKGLKRGYLVTDVDGTRSVRVRSTENLPDSTIFLQNELSIVTLEHEAHRTADERNLAIASANDASNSLSAIEASMPGDASAVVPNKLAVEDSHPEVIINPSQERAVKVNDSNSLQSLELTKRPHSPANMAAELIEVLEEDGCPEVILCSHDQKTFEVKHSTNDEVNTKIDKMNETCNLNSTNFDPDPEDTVNGVTLKHEASAPSVLSPEVETGHEYLSSGSDCRNLGPGVGKDASLGVESAGILIIDTSKGLEEASSMEKQDNSTPVPDEFACPAPAVNHNDAVAEELSNVEGTEALALEGIEFPSSRLSGLDEFACPKHPANHNDMTVEEFLNIEGTEELASESVKSPSSRNSNKPANSSEIYAAVHTDLSVTETRQDRIPSEFELLPANEVQDTPVDIVVLDREGRVEKEAISATGFTANGSLSVEPGSPSNPYLGSLRKRSHHLPTSSNGESAAAIPTETRQLSAGSPVDVPVGRATRSTPKKPENGTTMKSIEQMLAENSRNSGHGRGIKVAAKSSRRGRGRSRGRGK